MFTVGITGRSGSGKSTVSAYFRQKGHTVADGDEISRTVQAPHSACLKELVAHFGDSILASDGSLNRKALAALAFADKQSNQKLIEITHPHIINEFLRRRDAAENAGEKLFFADGAMIIGGPFEKYCDKIILLCAPKKLSVSRIVLRDNISKTLAHTRLASQLNDEQLCLSADYILQNDADKKQLLHKADEVLTALLTEVNNH